MSTYAVRPSFAPSRPRSGRPVRPVGVRATSATPARLTRRGRLALTLAFLVLALLALASLRTTVMATGQSEGPATSYVVVAPGQTLWQIAGDVAPGADRRATVARLLQLNDLPSASLRVGQRLAVPLG